MFVTFILGNEEVKCCCCMLIILEHYGGHLYSTICKCSEMITKSQLTLLGKRLTVIVSNLIIQFLVILVAFSAEILGAVTSRDELVSISVLKQCKKLNRNGYSKIRLSGYYSKMRGVLWSKIR